MQISLRERDLDTAVAECFVDCTVQLMLYAAAIDGLVDPAEQFEIET